MIFKLKKESLLDYPGEIASIVYTFGCNLRCPYCYNIDLWYKNIDNDTYTYQEIVDYFKIAKGKITAVVFSGGEPLLNPSILKLIKLLKRLGYKIKVFTNGTNYSLFCKVLKYVDIINVSIKTALNSYKYLCASKESISNLKKVLNVRSGKIEYCTVNYKKLGVPKDFMNLNVTQIKPKLDTPILKDARSLDLH